MQVSSIQNYSFGNKNNNVKDFMLMDDESIRQYAIYSAAEKNQKSRRKANRLYYSIPLIAAASAAILKKSPSTFLRNEVSGKAARLGNAIKDGAYWTFLLGTVAAGAGLNNKLEARSEKYKNFRQDHPVLSVLGDLTAFLAVTLAVPKALSAVYSKLGPKTVGRINNVVAKGAEKVNNIKAPKFVKTFGEKLSKAVPQRVKDWKANKVMPQSLKSIAKGVVAWAPEITLLSTLVSAIDSRAKFLRDVDKTYTQIREKQQDLINERLAAMDE